MAVWSSSSSTGSGEWESCVTLNGMADPLVVVVAGFAGVGKSRLAGHLARSLDAVLLDKDTLSNAFVSALLAAVGGDPDDRHSGLYLSEARPLEYGQMEAVAFDNIALGRNVVLCAPFTAEVNSLDWYPQARARFEAAGASLHVVWIGCDPDTNLERLLGRGSVRDCWKLANWDDYVAGMADVSPRCPHTWIDNSADEDTGRRRVAEVAGQLLGQ